MRREKNISYLYRGIQKCKEGYQIWTNLVKNEKCDLFTDPHSILNKRKSHFINCWMYLYVGLIIQHLIFYENMYKREEITGLITRQMCLKCYTLWIFSDLVLFLLFYRNSGWRFFCYLDASVDFTMKQCSFHVLMLVTKLFFSTSNSVKLFVYEIRW